MTKLSDIETIDAYIDVFPKPVQKLLESVWQTIRKAAPDAMECINYKMPTFRLNGKNLVHFAAYEHHIGFYPTPDAITAFAAEIADYKNAKGSVQFPLDKPMPLDLISKMTAFRVKQMEEKVKTKPSKAAPGKNFMESLSAPAQRALANEGIKTLKQLSAYSEASLLKLHGFGKASLPILRSALAHAGLGFKQ
ncbi:hypothetical protein F0919_12370 [Taibaiella lutea]|uniref:YdhG-like domain-containing protein n=1 Tax=Taibaiella lutea TaxID=2608001 RepID=A0A5M6CDT8_9BACT|nr:DUF1801 domain-containing protein [Taibaiella lutea]KAA5533334.1 hypothetical protein F0919_12370 [Taibaiella lutea]